jgi:hypothetical protein
MPDPIMVEIIAAARATLASYEARDEWDAESMARLQKAVDRYDEHKPFVAPSRRIRRTHTLGQGGA